MLLLKSLGTAFAAAAVTAALLYLWQQHRNEEALALRTSNQELRREVLARSRRATEPPAASHGSEPARVVPHRTPAATASEHPAEADYRDDGQATPGAALQTIAWACDRGDEARMAKLITFESAARRKAEAYLASLPPETRGRYPTAETLAAMTLVADGMQRPYPRARLLSGATIEPVAHDVVRVRLPGTPKDGGLYQQTSDGWKWLITEAMVDAYLAQAQGSHASK